MFKLFLKDIILDYYIMSFSNATGRFDLNNVIVRKPLMYPDGSVQSSAFYGNRIEITDGPRSTTLLDLSLISFDSIDNIENNKVYSYSGYLTIVNDGNVKTNCKFQIEQEADGTTNYLGSYGPITFDSNQTINIPFSTIQSSGTAGGGTTFSLSCNWTGAGTATFTYYRCETFKLCDLIT